LETCHELFYVAAVQEMMLRWRRARHSSTACRAPRSRCPLSDAS